MKAIEKTVFPGLAPFGELEFYSREKIWDAWDLSADRYLLVATDRVWLNGILAGVIPGKGKCLAELVLFWADFFKKAIGTFIVSGDLSYACNHSVWLESWNNDLEGRALIVKKLPIMPFHWIVGKELSGKSKILSIDVKTGQELSHKETVAVLEKWIARKKIKDRETGKAPEAESLKRKVDSLSGCLFRKASAHVTARKLSLCCSVLSFGWFGGEPVLVGDFFTPNSASLALLEDQGECSDSLVQAWLAKKEWPADGTAPKIPDGVLEEAMGRYQEILKRLRS